VTRRRLLRLAQARHRLLRLQRTSGCLGTSRGSSCSSLSTTSTTPHVRVARHVARLVTRLVVDYFDYTVRSGASARRATHHATRRTARRRLLHLRRTSGCLGTSCGSSSTTSPMSRLRVPRHIVRLVTRLVVEYFDYAARPGASAHRTAHHAARRLLLHLRRTSHGLSCDSSSTTSPRAGSSSTTSPTPRVWVPRLVVRLITRLVVDYFDYAARPGASAHLAAHHATRRAARRRLLLLRCASGCLGMSRGTSSTTSPRAGSSSTTSPTPRVWVPRHVTRLVVENFDHATRPDASARRAAHHATRHAARRRLLPLRRVSGCLGTSCGSSRGSSSTTSPMPHVRLLRHVGRLDA
jgi:hypothetical protein